jgi:hypothetical protein
MDGALSTLAPIFAVVLAHPSPAHHLLNRDCGTFLGGVFHTLPFLIPSYQTAIAATIAIVAVELPPIGLAAPQVLNTSFLRSFVSVTVGGAIIASLSAALGVLAAG